jgi:hypothetical protein
MKNAHLWEDVSGSRLCLETALTICVNDNGIKLERPEECFLNECSAHLLSLLSFLYFHGRDSSKVPYVHEIEKLMKVKKCIDVVLPPLPSERDLLEQGKYESLT